jgi:cellobiose phosphorylase
VFEAIRAGNVPVKGGWRIYSSGPGILLNQVITSFLGIRDYYEYRVIDPVLPKMLNGLRFTWVEEGKSVTYVFSIAHDEPAAVQSLTINGLEVAFVRQDNPYRHGGAMIQRSTFHALLNHPENIVGVNMAQDC